MNKQHFTEGIRDGFPICLGYFSVSMAFGLAGVLSGIPVWTVVLISLTNLTSAGQFAGINLLIAQGSMIELALTTLIINIRYFLMSLSVSQKVSSKMSIPERMAVSFGITDEIFAVSMQHRGELTVSYMAGVILTPVIGWTGGTFAGAVATSFMPATLSAAMGIALYGMFIAIVIPAAKEHRNVLFAVLSAVALSTAFPYLPVLKELSSGWAIIVITLIVCAAAAWLFPIETEENEEDS
ncbi:MAG: AzlC family ABC transporter permease [Lachnospiraceae bacterium]